MHLKMAKRRVLPFCTTIIPWRRCCHLCVVNARNRWPLQIGTSTRRIPEYRDNVERDGLRADGGVESDEEGGAVATLDGDRSGGEDVGGMAKAFWGKAKGGVRTKGDTVCNWMWCRTSSFTRCGSPEASLVLGRSKRWRWGGLGGKKSPRKHGMDGRGDEALCLARACLLLIGVFSYTATTAARAKP